MTRIARVGFVEEDQQKASALKLRVGKKRADVAPQPLVRLAKHSSVVAIRASRTSGAIVDLIWNDKTEGGKSAGIEVGAELPKRNDSGRLSGIVNDIAEEGEWIVVLQIIPRIAA